MRTTLLTFIIMLITGLSSLHAQGVNTDTYTILITADSVADCNTFYFNILIKSSTGLYLRTFQGDIWISDAFLNVSPIPSGGKLFSNATVAVVPGSSAIGIQFGAQQIVTPTEGGSPPGTGGDTAVIRFNTIAIICPGAFITKDYVRLARIKVTRTGDGCWGGPNINSNLGWYTGDNGGNKTTFAITEWVPTCGMGANFKLETSSGTYLTELRLSKKGPEK